MPQKATNDAAPPPPTISGKWLIISVLVVALIGAIGSWVFRYNSTHQTAIFWGPETATLIRDAPTVQFYTFPEPLMLKPSKVVHISKEQILGAHPEEPRDITAARGLVHLRNALIEDRSYEWPVQTLSDDKATAIQWKYAICFSDSERNKNTYVLFAPDDQLVTAVDSSAALSYKPVAKGVDEMFAEFLQPAANEAAKPAR